MLRLLFAEQVRIEDAVAGNYMRDNLWATSLICFVLLFEGVTLPQVQQQSRTLVINGQVGEAVVVQLNGRTYVEMEALARIANGSLGFQGDQILLTLRSGSTPATPPASSNPGDSAFSRDFMRAAIEQMAQMREWASTLANAIQNGYPVADNWVNDYREQAAHSLRLATVAGSTEADRKGLQLLDNEFEAVRKWSNKLVEARKSMDTAKYAMSASALQDEPLSQKIITCGRFLAPMLASGNFQDDPSCH
jgi:hypothetical protein